MTCWFEMCKSSFRLLFHLVTSHNVGRSLYYCWLHSSFISLSEKKRIRVWTLFQFIFLSLYGTETWICVQSLLSLNSHLDLYDAVIQWQCAFDYLPIVHPTQSTYTVVDRLRDCCRVVVSFFLLSSSSSSLSC